MASQAQKVQQNNLRAICDMCESDGKSICRNCLRFVCDKCKEIYKTDLCNVTKARHIFNELKKIPQNKRSSDVETLSSQHGASVNEGMVNDGKEWSCSRCTYLNPPDYKICAMCASSRGFTSVDPTESKSRVCRNCTFHNKASTTVCEACHKTLDKDPFSNRAAEVQCPALNDQTLSQPEKALQKDLNAICYSCDSDDSIICQNCDRYVCGKCKEIYLCSATKGQHIFEVTDLEQWSAGGADEGTELGLGPILG